jgi:hypothetical protein
MDTTVWVAIIVAVSTLIASLGATWLNNLSSNKRFQIELGRAMDVDHRTRRWQVRSEPLLKLRAELAETATRNNKLLLAALTLHDAKNTDTNYENARKSFDYIYSELRKYFVSGVLDNALNSIDDQEIIDKVNSIISASSATYSYILNKEQFPPEAAVTIKSAEQIQYDIRRIQALINDCLEKL